MIRFFDRYDPDGGVRSSAVAHPPWSDDAMTAEALGARHRGGYRRWSALPEASGRAALLSACRGSNCDFYAVAEDRPVVRLQLGTRAAALFRRVVARGVVRLGERWYFATDGPHDALDLWRADLGAVHHVRQYPRLGRQRHGQAEPPRLVRRARGPDLGFFITVPPDPSTGSSVGTWAVLPIDPRSGALGEPMVLGPDDLSGQPPPPCAGRDNGWIVGQRLAIAPMVAVAGAHGYLDEVELRLRIDPAGACVESMAARGSRGFGPRQDGSAPRRLGRSARVAAEPPIPLVVHGRDGDARWLLECRGGAGER